MNRNVMILERTTINKASVWPDMMQDVHMKFYPGFPWDMSKTLLT